MEVATLDWDLLGFSSCALGLVKPMALLSWLADPAFCSLQAQTLLGLSSPLCLAIQPHSRLSSLYIMAKDNCSKCGGSRHWSSSWDLAGLALPQDCHLGALFLHVLCHQGRRPHLTMVPQISANA